jgi:hypothetical protein
MVNKTQNLQHLETPHICQTCNPISVSERCYVRFRYYLVLDQRDFEVEPAATPAAPTPLGG